MSDQRRPRERNQWLVCEDTGEHAVVGVCPTHRGDACLIVVAWVDNSHVRRELAAVNAKLTAARFATGSHNKSLRTYVWERFKDLRPADEDAVPLVEARLDAARDAIDAAEEWLATAHPDA